VTASVAPAPPFVVAVLTPAAVTAASTMLKAMIPVQNRAPARQPIPDPGIP
jgi:hypothetical protein